MKIAIIGAAYTGLEAARYLKSKGHTITVTTTKEARVAELEPVSDHVIVMTGEDRDMMREVLTGQDAVLMTVAGGMVEKEGKYIMDPDLYRSTYCGTAESIVDSLAAAPDLKQIIFTGSWSVYGNAGGADHVDENTPATPVGPFQQVYQEAENTLLAAETDTLKVAIYRTGTIYGPAAGYMPRELKASTLPMAGLSIPFDGESPATIIHRDDVVKALEFGCDNHLSGIYNLVNDISASKADFFGAIVAEAGLEPVTWLGNGTGPKNLSNQKIKDAGYVFLDPLAEGDGKGLL
jgi:nucleoside-diphosphate-sugar epimerase